LLVLNWFRLYLLFDSCYCKVHATYCVSFYKFITGCNCTESDFWMFWVTNKSERKKYLGTNFVILLTIFVKILRSKFRSFRFCQQPYKGLPICRQSGVGWALYETAVKRGGVWRPLLCVAFHLIEAITQGAKADTEELGGFVFISVAGFQGLLDIGPLDLF